MRGREASGWEGGRVRWVSLRVGLWGGGGGEAEAEAEADAEAESEDNGVGEG